MKLLDHDRIIHLHELYETTHSIYLVMDLVTGGELLKSLMSNEVYDLLKIINVMKKLLEVLKYLKLKKVAHRDLKPENILLRNEADNTDILIADFGLSTLLNGSEIIFNHCGTPGYIAPEVLNYASGQEFYDEQCDIFSVGVIFYIL